MTPEPRARLAEIEALFAAARELPAAARAAFLETCCRDDSDLRREVDELLALAEAGGTPLDAPADPWSGRRIDRWRLGERLGAGGMGVVYRAHRDDGAFRQEAALKLLKHELGGAALVERFRQERQVLAALSHPAIARLIDGGATEEGVPWFAMERVVGDRLDDWCDARRLPLRERLTLFVRICQAVHYAHQQLVLHRDLKPSNVLVTADGEPKLVDFGISKVLEPERTTPTAAPGPAASSGARPDPLTRAAERRLTPEYSAPEVIRGAPPRTSSDVFSLGVMLHELLTGVRPWASAEGSLTALERAICETLPARPSRSALTTAAAAARGLAEPALRRALRGDLDAIVQTALAAEPERRYASAQALADDVERALRNEPIAARAPGALYVLGRFARRHRVATIAALLAAGALAGGALSAWRGERAARRHAAASEHVTDLLSEMVAALDPSQPRDSGARLLAQLDAAARALEDGRFADAPQAAFELRGTLGRAYLAQGHWARAEAQFAAALAIEAGSGERGALGRSELLRLHANALRNEGRPVDAAAELRAARALLERGSDGATSDGATRAELSFVLHELGLALARAGQPHEAMAAIDEALALRAALGDTTSEAVAGLHNARSGCELELGDPVAAEASARASLALREALSPDGSPRVAWSLEQLAMLLLRQRRPAEALPFAERALSMRRGCFERGSPVIAASLQQRANLLEALGRGEEAARDRAEAAAAAQ